MKSNIEIIGFDRVRRMARNAPRTVDGEARKGLRDSAAVVRGQAISNARQFSIGNRFPSSIRYRVNGLTAIIGSLAPTALSIEQGRRQGEVVRRGLILSWLQRRGLLRGVVSVKTHRLRRLTARQRALRDIPAEERREAARIVEQIRQRGTSPHPFLLRSVDQQKDKIKRIMNKALGEALRKVVRAA